MGLTGPQSALPPAKNDILIYKKEREREKDKKKREETTKKGRERKGIVLLVRPIRFKSSAASLACM